MERLAEAMNDSGVRCQVRARLRTIEYTLGLVAAGVGASLVPAWPDILARTDVQCRSLEGLDIHQTIGIAYPARGATPALEPLLELAREINTRGENDWHGVQSVSRQHCGVALRFERWRFGRQLHAIHPYCCVAGGWLCRGRDRRVPAHDGPG
ncbi:hypothetical protein GCM10007160_19380 [Litchfieldella qijiaojingensis]|uniref:LysR substrate-binding domain-containing protein n=2 Tax=Litchfieldella qijiaojingensis TaxID=980347 RepID=A0ABQ2YTI3_9GAMM|nr:hypothetical protein GCM10007160_19380 [Halomonas qijiaojingensis]